MDNNLQIENYSIQVTRNILQTLKQLPRLVYNPIRFA